MATACLLRPTSSRGTPASEEAPADRPVVASADAERPHLLGVADRVDVRVPASADERDRDVQEADAQPEVGQAAAGRVPTLQDRVRRHRPLPDLVTVVAGQQQGTVQLGLEQAERGVRTARAGGQELHLGARGSVPIPLALDERQAQRLGHRRARVRGAAASRAQGDREPTAQLGPQGGGGVGIVPSRAGADQVVGSTPRRVGGVGGTGSQAGARVRGRGYRIRRKND